MAHSKIDTGQLMAAVGKFMEHFEDVFLHKDPNKLFRFFCVKIEINCI